MDLLASLAGGFAVALTPTNLLFCLAGCLLGTLIGVLPGIGPLAALAMLLPITFQLEPATGLIMLAGIYYGAQYGGSTTAILVNVPGETSSVITVIDGYQMALRGRAGAALAIAAIGSFFAGTVATGIIAGFAPVLASLGERFTEADYFSLMVLGLVGTIVLARGDIFRAIGMTLAGLLIGLVGTDIYTGSARFTFGVPELSDGVDFVAVALGLFGLGEILANLGSPEKGRDTEPKRIDRLWMTRQEFRAAWPAILRGTGIGSVLGLLPGGGALLGSFASYAVEKRIARDPSRFGRGAIEGLAGPEAANNAGAQTSFIPMLTLGIPSNAIMAVMIGGLMIHGIAPGPQLMAARPELFWGTVASMWIGNLMLLVINLPLVGLWVKLLSIPYRVLYPSIVLFCCIGVYATTSSPFWVYAAALFGLLGYLFHLARCEIAPFLLGLVLGPLMEEHLRRAMLLSRGDPMVFLSSPASLALLIASALLLGSTLMPRSRKAREAIFTED